MKWLRIAVVVGCAVVLSSCRVVPKAEVWAWCGISPSDLHFAEKTQALKDSGVDATFGPCLPPAAGYTPAFPVGRYDTPANYLTLVQRNATLGVKTVVYDARLWSDVADDRNAALQMWLPVSQWISAVDMGDEFDEAEFLVLAHRWSIVRTYITPTLKAYPFTNLMGVRCVVTCATGSTYYMEWALAHLPGTASLLSFDAYDVPNGAIPDAVWADPLVQTLMCAVSVTPDVAGYMGNAPSLPATDSGVTIYTNMMNLRGAGCDAFLLFNAGDAVNTPPFSGVQSVHDWTPPYKINSWGAHVLLGAMVAP